MIRASSLCAMLAAAGAACLAGPVPENGVTAHRGDSVRCPENTLEAFSSANDVGADWIETDVHLTSDGKLVISHNHTTGAYCSQDLVIAKSTLAELSRLDMAEKFRARNKLTPEQCPKRRIALLEEAIDLVLAQRKARLSIQPKCDCVDQVIALVRRKNAMGWVGFNDGNLRLMSRVKELEPSIPVFWDRWKCDVEADVPIARKRGFESIVPNRQFVTPDMVRRLHGAGFKVGVWTVNDPAEMKRFLEMGVDRIYTDVPKTLMELKARTASSTGD